MKANIQSYMRLVRLLPLLCFAWYYGNITFCTHTHVIDGKIMAHSHAGSQQHGHQTADFQYIHALSHVFFLKSAFVSLHILSFDIDCFLGQLKSLISSVAPMCHFSLRAPPVLG